MEELHLAQTGCSQENGLDRPAACRSFFRLLFNCCSSLCLMSSLGAFQLMFFPLVLSIIETSKCLGQVIILQKIKPLSDCLSKRGGS